MNQYANYTVVNDEIRPISVYRVKHPNGRSTVVFAGGRTQFYSYEAARQAVRKLLRKKVKGADRYSLDALKFGMWDSTSRNPTQLGGYRIERV